jgi:diaminohydroxyphosphoribosylaminopyrimidine deaminase/5-amino-6-(5-phosphoribosylamino)uracil reductase
MARALELARAAKGGTSPNPAVGAVVVRDGAIVGEGATQPGGRPHAETVALQAAGQAARGAALYVTLEPCAHHGRTPPCVEAVMAAGIAEVHLATLDPNPAVRGQGRARLEAAGIRTFTGEGAQEARALNEDFARWITSGRPYVIAKFAASLDGRIATHTGDSRWITGPEARAEAHRLRAQVDAVLVGAGTVLADDPELTVRLGAGGWPARQPRRIVLDSLARTPPSARLLSRALPGRVTICVTEAAPAGRRAALAAAGAEVWVLPADGGRVSLPALLDELGRRQVTSLLVEGGATVHGAFFDADLVDRVCAFLAPVVIGGKDAPGAVAGRGAPLLAGAKRLLDMEVRRLGADTLIAGYVRRVHWPE